MNLSIVEMFPTLQGEGSMAGSPSVFLRLSGCNMWSGYEKTREKGAGDCSLWCDTWFAKGNKLDPENICDNILALTGSWAHPMVVVTGGEPLLQLRRKGAGRTLELLREHGVYLALETNGTINDSVVELFDHVTVSPKLLKSDPTTLDHVKLRKGTDLKVVMPQWGMDQLREMDKWDFEFKYVQPCDPGEGGGMYEATMKAINTAQEMGWKVSVQTHKLIGLP